MKKRVVNIKAFLAFILCVAAVLGIATVKLSDKPVRADAGAVTMTAYGTVDRSTASQGHITFTASGKERCFVLQDPNGGQAIFAAQKDETVEVPIAGGTGSYQYAIADIGSDGKTCTVQYKDSFAVNEIGASTASASWGGCGNTT